jgi:hypothetical protein
MNAILKGMLRCNCVVVVLGAYGSGLTKGFFMKPNDTRKQRAKAHCLCESSERSERF